MIEEYGFGMISFEGYSYADDLIVFPDQMIEGWRREEGHRVSLADIRKALESQPYDVLVIGTGKFGLMHITSDFKAYLAQNNISYFAEPTDKAIERYNALTGSGKRVIAAFHLTC
ncbi:MAG TPA: hypothetical protein ENN17_00805 [bacterium]|nr:hypothetical protein [bacterium]